MAGRGTGPAVRVAAAALSLATRDPAQIPGKWRENDIQPAQSRTAQNKLMHIYERLFQPVSIAMYCPVLL